MNVWFLHCNLCSRLPTEDIHFFVGECGHVGCSKCVDAEPSKMQPNCGVCKKPAKLRKVDEKMRSHKFFEDPVPALEKLGASLKKMERTGLFGKKVKPQRKGAERKAAKHRPKNAQPKASTSKEAPREQPSGAPSAAEEPKAKPAGPPVEFFVPLNDTGPRRAEWSSKKRRSERRSERRKK
ncbi:hypothetical protein M3Y99_01215000 [Aphelenchoides fujianensis]|nr:hypothetical protein M3Y99_01215000 [Aphelenchoides fujianensis]